MRVKLCALLAIATTLGLSAPPASAQQPVVLKVAIVQQIDSMNPFLAVFQSSTEIGRLMYDYLTAYAAEDQSVTEGLANRWEPSPDRLTWTFTVPEGKTWSDGVPITARDVAFTYDLMLTDEVARTANGSFVSNFAEVTAPDDRTVVIRTKTPQVTMLALDVPIVPEHVWSKVGSIKDFANDKMPVVGSGPFVLSEHVPGQFIKLQANKTYWRGAPKYDELHFVYFQNSDAAVQALAKGEIDLVNRMAPAQFDSLQGKAGVTRNKAMGRRFTELMINPGAQTRTGEPIGDGSPVLRDVRVRRALAQAIDLDALVARVNLGYAEKGAGLVPPVFGKYHWQPSAAEARTFDPAAAGAALDAAGYPRKADGTRFPLRLIGRAGRAYDEQASEYLKRSMSDIGVPLDVRLVSDNQLNESTTAATYDLAFSGWSTNIDPDFVLSLHTCAQRPGADGKGGTTDTYFCDETYDKLYAQQLSEFDEARRVEIVKQMQARFYDQVPAVVLAYENALEGYRSDHFARFTTQPAQGGVIMAQNGMWGYYGAEPAQRTAQAASTGWTGFAVAGGVVAALVAAFVVLARRRRATAGERE
ncbi:ABC transporter substrate-binding protein [Lentzea flaviverrucosa]|uniref:Peptide/nickel transport system substrate-binding protein n=1 Tax=Lentzea flaviverrucosa TaxID=200379 RepID=A0A1H9APS1_9PSEU|nr:ABC transporter substrate-binding protein [Lentzea flaviverrucosa]RDI32005.1 peptide/nickel transport system substrate-binding protein [Lentzea flaviverrucosa]SEP78551.1 peptide/nickel transport system substrate-binding protein [Lentzea flaviverrucosa]